MVAVDPFFKRDEYLRWLQQQGDSSIPWLSVRSYGIVFDRLVCLQVSNPGKFHHSWTCLVVRGSAANKQVG